MLSWPVKDPNEVLDYQIDWTDRFVDGETIATSAFSVVEGDVIVAVSPPASFNMDGVATVWLTGGTAGIACLILNRITTSDGRTYDQSVRLRIRDK